MDLPTGESIAITIRKLSNKLNASPRHIVFDECQELLVLCTVMKPTFYFILERNRTLLLLNAVRSAANNSLNLYFKQCYIRNVLEKASIEIGVQLRICSLDLDHYG